MAANAPLALCFCFLLGALAVASAQNFAPPPLRCFQSAQLAPCLGAVLGTGPPTAACCTQLMAQRGCLCEYVLQPVPFLANITTAVGKNLLKVCGVAPLSC